MGRISQPVERWAAARGISRSTLERLGVGSGTTAMGSGQPVEVIAFPYKRGGKVVNVKYRSIEGKAFRQQAGGEARFWNLDAVLATTPDQAFIFEGEMDALAAVEAGVPVEQVLSVPTGAPSQSPDEATSVKYDYVDEGLREGLAGRWKIVLCTDNDPNGHVLRHDLARFFGPARCHFVEWPDGIKDANEYLMRHGAEALRMYLHEAQQEWPVVGLYRLSELPEPPVLERWLPGFPEWGDRLAFAPTMLNIFTGYPGHGKTLAAMQMNFQMCRNYGLKAAFASFETRPKPHHRRNIRQFMFGQREGNLPDQQRQIADHWIDENLFWITHPNSKPTLRWYLDMAEVAIVRHGVRIVQIDPWNKLDSDKPAGMPETEWIGRCLDELLDFAVSFRVLVQVLCHPAKNNDPSSRGRAPTLDDIAGSAHWRNRADLGLSIHRPKTFSDGVRQTEAALYVLKAKYEELGHECKLPLNFNLNVGRFEPTEFER